MSYIIIPSRRTRQPTGPVRVNWSNPLTRGLIFAINHAYGPFDLVGGIGLATDVGTVDNRSAVGNLVGIKTTNGLRYITNPSDVLRINSGPVTHVGVINCNAFDEAWGGVFGVSDASANSSFSFQRYDTTTNLAIFRSNEQNAQFTSTAASLFNDKTNVFVAISPAAVATTSHTLWINSTKYTANSAGAATTQAGAGVTANFFSGRGKTSSSTSGVYGAHFAYNRVLSDAESREIVANIWQLLAPDVRRLYFGATGGGTTDALTADGLTSGAPTLGTPTLSGTHILTGVGLTSGAPTLGEPTLAGTHVLTGVALTSGAPTLGEPTLSENSADHNLSADALASGAPTLGEPTLAQVHGFTAAGLLGASPILSSPTFGQTHLLTADGIISGAPTLGEPTLVEAGHALAADGLLAGVPTLGEPTLAVEGEALGGSPIRRRKRYLIRDRIYDDLDPADVVEAAKEAGVDLGDVREVTKERTKPVAKPRHADDDGREYWLPQEFWGRAAGRQRQEATSPLTTEFYRAVEALSGPQAALQQRLALRRRQEEEAILLLTA